MAEDKLIELYHFFQESAVILSSTGLYKAAKWSAEVLNGLPSLTKPQTQKLEMFQSSLEAKDNKICQHEMQETSKIILAKAYFDCKEYDRAVNLLKNCKCSRAIFIKLYSMYISCEKKIQEEFHEILGEKHLSYENKNVSMILREIEQFFNTLDSAEEASYLEQINYSLLYYLAGMIYLRQKDYKMAQQNFFESLKLYQYNWECWNDLLSSCTSFDEAVNVLNSITAFGIGDSKLTKKDDRHGKSSLSGSKHEYNDASEAIYDDIMMKIFTIVIYQEFYQQNTGLYQSLDKLIEMVPGFVFLKTQKALISYQALNYPLAESLFDEILIIDPYNLDHMDTYSNILYVMENKAKLSFLAQFANSIDKFRPETCCIIANFYSLKFEHEKAIMYYKRALNLNKNCLSAWTLMGHEFVELKNSHAAIESYRRAVDINQKDFRAWYGLGQAYEVLDMYLYSLYYYQRACELKPLDKRMWTAVGNCYEKLGKYKESIKSYKKILNINVSDDDVTFVLFKLGKLYEMVQDTENAEIYMKLCFNEEEATGIMTEETNKSRLWLARRELGKGNYKAAYDYASEFNSGTSQEIEEARAIIRECRKR
ncbi:anaphase promoting complex subunit [Saccharomycopsis crataegensis]|uniref:Anaphase promoting complex subunit n=1 Tax=Saccharomycopsis crataegensis TaxID=43959 RepID=A0AAV5QDQ5_9ASCO|nr:anaphase promoting complex subunit [Saccharomycopsis crataegensis]